MRLLLFNLVTDADDPVLGFTTNWIVALAKRMESVHVITMQAGRVRVPGNVTVTSIGKEKGYSEPRRAIEFYRALLHVLHHQDIHVCFSHMMPLFTVMAAPILKVRRIPIITWFAHPRLTFTLRLAHHLSDRMVSSLPSAYPYKIDKLSVVGQGIDTNLFSTQQDSVASEPPAILCVGRLSPVKGQLSLIEATALLRGRLHRPFLVRLLGGPAKQEDESYVRLLENRVKELGLQDVVEFHPPVPMAQLPAQYRKATLHVNLTPTGSGDKAALEAMSCGRICLMANEGFHDTLGCYSDLLLFRHSDPPHLAERLEVILSLTQEERSYLGVFLRDRVVAMHSLERLAGNLVHLFQRLSE